MSRITKSIAVKNLDEHFTGKMCCQKEWAYIRSYINEAGRTVRAKRPAQQAQPKIAQTIMVSFKEMNLGNDTDGAALAARVVAHYQACADPLP